MQALRPTAQGMLWLSELLGSCKAHSMIHRAMCTAGVHASANTNTSTSSTARTQSINCVHNVDTLDADLGEELNFNSSTDHHDEASDASISNEELLDDESDAEVSQDSVLSEQPPCNPLAPTQQSDAAPVPVVDQRLFGGDGNHASSFMLNVLASLGKAPTLPQDASDRLHPSSLMTKTQFATELSCLQGRFALSNKAIAAVAKLLQKIFPQIDLPR